MMSLLDVRDERIKGVISDTVEMDLLASDFGFIEGPIWNHDENHLTFSDIPKSEMLRWHDNGELLSYRKPSNMANGSAYDQQGRIVSCEHETSQVVREEVDGSLRPLATHFKLKQLNSPNDVIVAKNSRIYFTDPTYGRMEYFGVKRESELSYQGVYSVDAEGNDLRLHAEDFKQPNGLCMSIDGSSLYVNDTEKSHIRRFDVRPNGDLSGGEIWAVVSGDGEGAPDGMKVDSHGNVYTTGPGGVHVFSSAAQCLGVIKVPEVCANFTWGGDDMCSLFFTASTSLYRIRVLVPGPKLY